MRGPRTAMKSGPRLPQLETALAQKRRPNTAKNKLKKKKSHGVICVALETLPSYCSITVICRALSSSVKRWEHHIHSWLQLFNSVLFCESSHRWYINEWAWLCTSKTLFMHTQIWISCNFNVWWNGCTNIGGMLDLACRLGFSDPWSSRGARPAS